MAAKIDISIDQGATFNRTFLVQNEDGESFDISDHTANVTMKKTYTSLTHATFEANTSNGGLSISMSADVTGNLEGGRYVYDALLTSTTNTYIRLIEGIITVKPRVT